MSGESVTPGVVTILITLILNIPTPGLITFVLQKHLPLIVSTSTLAAIWLDHDPILVVCHSLLCKPQHSSWVMNDSLLSFKEILADIHQVSMDYFHLNAGMVSSPVTLWEAYKAVVRGHVIQLATKRKRERLLARCTLEQHLESMLTTFKQSPTPDNRKLLDQACTDLDL